MLGQNFRNRGKRDAADPAREHIPRVREDGHLLARLIRSVPRRIAAAIGGDDQQVVVLDGVNQNRQPAIEVLESGGISGGIAAMPVITGAKDKG